MTKYSYMPVDQGSSSIGDCSNNGYGYFIDSDDRILYFRNQYGERFTLVSRKIIRSSLLIFFICGFLLGKLI